MSEFVRFGDEAAFRALYRRHTPALHRLVARLLGREHSADDVLQVAWIRAAENLHRFRWASSLRSWLTGIAINCCRETRRSEARHATDVLDVERHGARTNGSHAAGLRIDLERAVDALPERYREVLILHDVEGYTHVEIAELLGIEAGTSKSQLSRARRSLRTRLNEAAPPEGNARAVIGKRER